jgi:competence protein ComEA
MARLRGPRGYVPTAVDLQRNPRVSEAANSGSRTSRHASRSPGWRWVRLPVALEGARWQPGRSAVLGVVVVTLLAVAVFGLRVAWATSDEGGRVLAPGGGSRAGPTGVTAAAAPVGVPTDAGSRGTGGEATAGAGVVAPAGAPTATGTPGAAVVVHVVGHVRRPGVLRLAAGSRVAEALDAAGGPTSTADLARVNLARVLVDGEQVQVPAPGDPDPMGVGVGSAGPAVPARAGAAAAGGTAGAGTVLVALNTADVATLETLPGVGPVLAQRIVDWRSRHGRFTSVEELGEVTGIGDKLLAQLGPLVTL